MRSCQGSNIYRFGGIRVSSTCPFRIPTPPSVSLGLSYIDHSSRQPRLPFVNHGTVSRAERTTSVSYNSTSAYLVPSPRRTSPLDWVSFWNARKLTPCPSFEQHSLRQHISRPYRSPLFHLYPSVVLHIYISSLAHHLTTYSPFHVYSHSATGPTLPDSTYVGNFHWP